MLLWASIMASATPGGHATPLRARAACTASALSHGRGVRLLWRPLARYAPTLPPTPRFIRPSRDALLQKSLHPFVYKAPADPDPDSNVGDRDAIGEEEDNLGTSEQPGLDGGRPLPGEERLAFLRRKRDGESGCASTRHTASLCARGAARDHLGSREAQG